MPDPEHTCAEVRLRGPVIEEQACVARQARRVELVRHDQKHVYVLWVYLTRDERSQHREPRQVTGRSSDVVDTLEAERERPALSRADAEPVKNLAQRCGMDPKRQFTVVSQCW